MKPNMLEIFFMITDEDKDLYLLTTISYGREGSGVISGLWFGLTCDAEIHFCDQRYDSHDNDNQQVIIRVSLV